MKKDNRKMFFAAIALVIATITITSFVLTTFGFVGFLPREEYKKYRKVVALGEEVEDSFYKKADDKKLEEGMCKGLFYGLDDEYSSYYNKEEMKQIMEVSSGKYVGIGLVVSADKETGAIKVERTIPGGPAELAGVKKGDLIIKVDNKAYSYQEMDIAVKNMRGEAGTDTKVTFLRDGKALEKKIKRKEIKLDSVSSKIIDGNIGYIQITSFDEDTDVDFKKALDSLEKKNIKGLILDVRNNGGGYLNVVKNISDRLLGQGVIVYTKDNKGNKDYLRSDDKEKVDIPIAILTNEYSASASEILTGAIVDNKAGISIGKTTYGKGLVQSVVQLKDGSGYKLTTAQYFTPNGDYINKKGIKANIEVKDEEKQLPKAVEYIKEKIK
ncbi:peptidase S41 [Peptostreptococcus russellii]|uniref:Peptidase S41 n=1 Tax=Peptostreptococcus russellii TaxID=215200 RepID=A0A2P7PYP2_9FIRM|nr:S41 family peptidase [Peptostreptococcus russellii]PSJ30833.1 peptidase S41 [Peptostreptococcus russellii]